MSLVGTRPPTVDEWDKYELHHRARLATKPGLTGMWQVSGRSNITDFEEVVKLDKQYISEWTMGLDSIHDAIEAGFNKIVFIIRKDIKDAFKEAIGDRIEKICKDLDVEIAYAYQELNELPEGVELPAGRTKPWGTGQAVLACKEVLHEPFAVINADDYYGKEAFVKLHDFLVGYMPEKANQFCMAGFILKNTLSENGAVTRGICETNEEGYLTAVHETSNIVKTPEGAAVDNDGQLTSINAESYASMNMWGLTPEFMQTLEDGFKEFFANMGDKDILKAEYRQEQIRLLKEIPSEENLWQTIIAFQNYPFKTATGLPFRYKLKVGKNGEYNRELLIDRREKSKSLAWSSVVLAFENSKRISEEVKKPKALGDIRGVSYIYPILWRFGLIRVPEAIEKKMGKQR